MALLKEFKEFAVKGNAMDLAVGIIIGAAFGKIINSLVEHVIMPFIGIFFKGTDFKNWSVHINEAEIKYGLFISAILDFVIIAFVVFLIVKSLIRVKREKAPDDLAREEQLLTEIRDLLRNKEN